MTHDTLWLMKDDTRRNALNTRHHAWRYRYDVHKKHKRRTCIMWYMTRDTLTIDAHPHNEWRYDSTRWRIIHYTYDAYIMLVVYLARYIFHNVIIESGVEHRNLLCLAWHEIGFRATWIRRCMCSPSRSVDSRRCKQIGPFVTPICELILAIWRGRAKSLNLVTRRVESLNPGHSGNAWYNEMKWDVMKTDTF